MRLSGSFSRLKKCLVLPWVQGVEIEEYQPPEGMFGPYDSRERLLIFLSH